MALSKLFAPILPSSANTWLERRRVAKANRKPPETFKEHVVSWIKTIVWALTMVTFINGLVIASFTVPTGSMEDTVMPGDFVFVNKFIYGPSTPQIIPFLNQPLPYWKTPPVIDPKVGDVIVFVFPGDRDDLKARNFEYYLKRCMGTPGDVVEVRNRKVFVNNAEVPLPPLAKFIESRGSVPPEQEQFVTFPIGAGFTIDNYGPIRVPKKGDVITLTPENAMGWKVFIQREGHSFDPDALLLDGKPTTQYTVEQDYVFGMGDNRNRSLDSRFFGFIPINNVVGTPMFVYWSWENIDHEAEARRERAGLTGPQIERSLWEKLKRIRWSRFFTIIR
jgi:signal peptidase I